VEVASRAGSVLKSASCWSNESIPVRGGGQGRPLGLWQCLSGAFERVISWQALSVDAPAPAGLSTFGARCCVLPAAAVVAPPAAAPAGSRRARSPTTPNHR
jgi:hypothetical protein